MSKNNKSVGKKKWIAGGIIGFASITLIATGFATWVVGNQVMSTNGSVNVTVDTAKNNSVKIEAALSDNSLTIAEAYNPANESKPVKIDEADALTPDFAITFSSITVTMGQAYYESLSGLKLQFALAVPSEGIATDVTAKNTVDDTADLIGTREGGSYTYIALASDSVSSEDILNELTQSNGSYSYTLPDKTLNFTWGSFFDGKAPTEYYNGLIEAQTIGNDYDTLSKITNELNAMNAAFTKDGGATINVQVSLVPTPKN